MSCAIIIFDLKLWESMWFIWHGGVFRILRIILGELESWCYDCLLLVCVMEFRWHAGHGEAEGGHLGGLTRRG